MPLSRGERNFVLVFLPALIAMPLLTVECFPFSMMPMYCYSVREVACYRIFAPDGRELDTRAFRVDLVNLGSDAASPFHRHRARVASQSANVLGKPAWPLPELAARIRIPLARMKLPYVRVERTILGAVDARSAGPVESLTLLVGKPSPR